MKIFSDLNAWRQCRQALPQQLSMGFVPTMGHLHQGHLSLYETSKKENDCTVASIFVNPTQFDKADDFTFYPRTLEQDLQALKDTGVDYCLLPDEQSMYAEGYRFQLTENNYSLLMEGQHRPGHFNGVLTVVMKLLLLVKPHVAYFGEKDYQQLQLIRDMAKAFFIDTQISAGETVREASGLAYSSRHSRLTPEQRILANEFAMIFHQRTLTREEIINKLTALGVQVQYLEEYEGRRFIAITLGSIRLIDNYAL